MINEQTQQKIDLFKKIIDKQFDKGSVFIANTNNEFIDGLEVISTGSIGIDHILGIGGLPCGRIIEIYGPESSGKTTLTLQAIAEAQKTGGLAMFIDTEHALDLKYAENLGVQTDALMISQPSSGEEALNILETALEQKIFSIIVVDSVAALTPQAEIDGEIGQHFPGAQARLMSQALRKIVGKLDKTIVIFTNQLRYKIGVMFGNPETTSGGNALKFYASVRIDMRRTGSIEDKISETQKLNPKDKNLIANTVKVKIVKNKVASPFREFTIEILFGKGFNRLAEILDFAIYLNIIEQSGAWFNIVNTETGEVQKIQGRSTVLQMLENDSKWCNELEKQIRASLTKTTIIGNTNE